MPMPRKLTDEQVVEIRYAYEHQRDISDNDPEYPEVPVYVTENNLADRYGVSRSLIRKIVLGLIYADLEGPIDTARHAKAKEVVSAFTPTAVRVTLTRPGQAPQAFVHPPGTEVKVEAIVEDVSKYTASGRPVDKARTTTPKAEGTRKTGRKPKKQPSKMTNLEHKRYREEVAEREYEYGEADSAAPSRGGGSSAWMLAGE